MKRKRVLKLVSILTVLLALTLVGVLWLRQTRWQTFVGPTHKSLGLAISVQMPNDWYVEPATDPGIPGVSLSENAYLFFKKSRRRGWLAYGAQKYYARTTVLKGMSPQFCRFENRIRTYLRTPMTIFLPKVFIEFKPRLAQRCKARMLVLSYIAIVMYV